MTVTLKLGVGEFLGLLLSGEAAGEMAVLEEGSPQRVAASLTQER